MAQPRFEPRDCPVCGGKKSKPLFQQSFEKLAGATLMDGYDVVICQTCGAGFADDIPTQETFDAFYRDFSKYEDGPSTKTAAPPVSRKFRDMAELIQRFIPTRDSKVFEIGAATGELLKGLSDLGFSNVLASDPSPACIRLAHDWYNVPGVSGTVFSVATPEKPYDLVILIGVMEHIRDLNRTVDQFYRLVKKGGRVFIEVPDASRYDARLDAPYQEFSVEHINFFSKTSLINLMQLRGFRVLEAGHTMRPLHEVTCPCVYGAFEYTGENGVMTRDEETERGLRAYVDGCSKEDVRIRAAIQNALEPGEKMIVWGSGTHTLRLLATGGLDVAKVACFVDSNPKYQSQGLRGVSVLPPSQIQNRSEPILISSRSSQRAIQDTIRRTFGLKNRLIVLYPS